MMDMKVICSFLALVFSVSAYKTGPPVVKYPEICETMYPIGHHAETQHTKPPYNIQILSRHCYKKRAPLHIILYSTAADGYFEGFFLTSRTATMNTSYGTFDKLNDREVQTLTCGTTGPHNAVGHADARHYKSKNFTWTAPKDLMRDIFFEATVVKEKTEYWMNVRSPILSYNEDCEYLDDAYRSVPCTASYLIALLIYLVSR